MTKVLILIPDEFKCFSKFERKVSRITKNLSEFSVIYPKDKNGMIKRLFESREGVLLEHNTEWTTEDITHAIIFDDGEEFAEELDDLNKDNIPVRLIKIKITRVINIKKETKYKNIRSSPDYEYIGRGSYWGNPYSMYEEGEPREEVIRKFKYDFDRDLFPNKKKSEAIKLLGKRLGCFCKPNPCHGDVIADYLNSLDDGK